MARYRRERLRQKLLSRLYGQPELAWPTPPLAAAPPPFPPVSPPPPAGPTSPNLWGATPQLEGLVNSFTALVQKFGKELYGLNLSGDQALGVATELLEKMGDEVASLPTEEITNQLEAYLKARQIKQGASIKPVTGQLVEEGFYRNITDFRSDGDIDQGEPALAEVENPDEAISSGLAYVTIFPDDDEWLDNDMDGVIFIQGCRWRQWDNPQAYLPAMTRVSEGENPVDLGPTLYLSQSEIQEFFVEEGVGGTEEDQQIEQEENSEPSPLRHYLKLSQGPYRVTGEVYSMAELLEGTKAKAAVADPDDNIDGWYEYRLWVDGPDGNELADWDSLEETYNGLQRLTKAEAEVALEEKLEELRQHPDQIADYFRISPSVPERGKAVLKHYLKLSYRPYHQPYRQTSSRPMEGPGPAPPPRPRSRTICYQEKCQEPADYRIQTYLGGKRSYELLQKPDTRVYLCEKHFQERGGEAAFQDPRRPADTVEIDRIGPQKEALHKQAYRSLEETWNGGPPEYISPFGNYGPVGFSENAMDGGVAGKNVVRYALWGRPDPRPAHRGEQIVSYAVVQLEGEPDPVHGGVHVRYGLPGEVLPDQVRRDLPGGFGNEHMPKPAKATLKHYLKLSSHSVEARLRAALVEEVHGQGLYRAFAVCAREEGRPDAEAAFAFIAEEEGEHARKFLELVGEGVLPEIDPPTLKEGRETGDTRSNLRFAVADEQAAQRNYAAWADEAEEAKEMAVATTFRDALRDERFHELTFQRLLEEMA